MQRHPLRSNAKDDSAAFGIMRNQRRFLGFFLDRHYTRCFGYDTAWADCSVWTLVSTWSSQQSGIGLIAARGL
jgi:hypothetical protein